jgi:hypothetical protein
MKPSQAEIRNLKELAAILPPVFVIAKAKTGAKETVEQVDHYKTMLRYLVAGKTDKLQNYIDSAGSVNVAHNQLIQGMDERYKNIL